MHSPLHAPVHAAASPALPIELEGRSPGVRTAAAAARSAMAADTAVLLVAEPGLNAAAVAATIHGGSARAAAPFVRVDGGDPPVLVAQRLFGAEARGSRGGSIGEDSALARAGAGTLFLADVDQMPLAAQTRLARALHEGEVRLAGEFTPVRCRLVASSGPGIDLDAHVRRFHPELYRRLHGIRIDLPPLRERPEDMPQIVATLLAETSLACGRPCQLAPAAVTALSSLQWAGNLAQLRAALLRLVQRAERGLIRQEDVLADLEQRGSVGPAAGSVGGGVSLREARRTFEREYITTVLEQLDWRMPDAARVLGIDRANLYRKTRQLGMRRARTRPPS